jgi:general secretion pathway protein D
MLQGAVPGRGLAVAVCVLFFSFGTSLAQQIPQPLSVGSVPASTGQGVSATLPDAALTATLERKGNLTLRDATIVEALFALREQWNVDMVVSDDVAGQVNATFTGASLREILDSLLLSRGYGYQVVGRSVVIMPLNELGALKPLFNTDIIQLKHADPDELISVVDLLLSPQGKALPLVSAQSIMVLDYPDRMRLIRTRLEELDLAAGVKAQPTVATPTVPDGVDSFANPGNETIELDVRVFRPQFVKVQSLLPVIENLISRNGRAAVLEKEDQVMVADQEQILDVIEEAVMALDQPRPQVRIWAMIYDCSLDDVERLGVNWRSAGFGNGRRTVGMDQIPTNQILLDTITAAAPGIPNGALSLMSLGTNVDINVVINALRQSNQSRLLADPNVVVTNHEPAKISIVTEVPYQQLTEGLEGGSIGTTAFREAGVSLEVTPHIARDGTISLLVNPQFSVLTGFTENDEQPIIDRREAKTTVRVMDRETFVLGGLRQRTKITNRSGIPYLKDVRYVGKLFRYKQESFRESELLVFITPEIVPVTGDAKPRDDAANEFTREELNRNQRAPNVACSQVNWDGRSFGGPWKTSPLRSDFGFSEPVDASDENTDQSPTANVRLPMPPQIGVPYDETAQGLGTGPSFTDNSVDMETPPFVDVQRPASRPVTQPLTQRLQRSLEASNQGPAPGPASGSGVPPGTIPGAGGTGVDLNSLLDILQMSGEEPARSSAHRSSHSASPIRQLKFKKTEQRPATIAPIVIEGSGTSTRR